MIAPYLPKIKATPPSSTDTSTYKNHSIKTTPTIICYLNAPDEILLQIINFCDVPTLCTLRQVNKRFATIIDIECQFYKNKISNYSNAYSISSYKEFIRPSLDYFSPKIKNNIDSYLDTAENNPVFAKNISPFILKKILEATNNLEKNKFTVKSKYLSSHHNYDGFTISRLSNHWALVEDSSKVLIGSIGSVNTEDILTTLTSFYPHTSNRYGITLEFTHKNNLLTYTSSEVKLWKLNLTNNKDINNIENLWTQTAQELSIKKILLFNNETDFIASSKNKNMACIYSIQENITYKKLAHECLNFLDKEKKYNDNNFINDMTISANNSSLAIAINNDSNIVTTKGSLCIFSINKDAKIFDSNKFIRKELPVVHDGYNHNIKTYSKNMQFNASGNVFAYLNDRGERAVVLNKVNDTWFNCILLTDTNYIDIKIMPSEKHIVLAKEHKNYKFGVEVMSIKDMVIKSSPAPQYHRSYGYDSKKHRNKYLLDDDFQGGDIAIHPTGLAIISFDKYSKQVKIFFPKK
jgi:hypothetical protein